MSLLLFQWFSGSGVVHDLIIFLQMIHCSLSVFWPSDTESRINELRFSDSISLSFKTRLTAVTCFCGDDA